MIFIEIAHTRECVRPYCAGAEPLLAHLGDITDCLTVAQVISQETCTRLSKLVRFYYKDTRVIDCQYDL